MQQDIKNRIDIWKSNVELRNKEIATINFQAGKNLKEPINCCVFVIERLIEEGFLRETK